MYRGLRIAAVVPALNEEANIGRVVGRVDRSTVDTVIVVDDGSTDRTAAIARHGGARVLSVGRTRGVGAALRAGIGLARRDGYDVVVILAGNGKDDASEIPRLIDPLADRSADFTIGSRFAPGGSCGGDMPLYRRVATRLHPWLMSRLVGKRLTESTNGFRALRLTLLKDKRIHLDQPWLNGYGLEVYLLWKVLTLGYRHTEVPCSKIYPPRRQGYTKMRPVVDWWSLLSPMLLLGSGIRR